MYSPKSRKPHPRSRILRTCVATASILLLAISHSSVATADDPHALPSPVASEAATSVASTHFETGLALYGLGHFEDAVSEFRKAYEVQARPDFLLHIGRSFEQLGQSEKALYFFKRYISTAPPDAPERDEAKAFVAKFDTAPPSPTMQETTVAIAAPTAVHQTNDSVGDPLWKRWWFWTAIGVVAIATVSVGVVLSRGADDSPPQSDLGHMRF